MAAAHDFNLPGDEPHYTPDRFYRAEHLVLEITVDPDTHRIEGAASYTLRPVNAPLTENLPDVVLDAMEMEIEDVSPARSWSHADGKLLVQPDVALVSSPVLFSVRYSAEPRKGMYFIEPDEGYPERPRQIWTQGQAEDTRYWIPSFDFPNQKLTTEVIATVPDRLTVVSNGRLLAAEPAGPGRKRWHFKQEIPHPAYLMSLAAGEFSEVKDSWEGVPVSYFVQPGREDDARRAFGNTPRMIDFFSKATGVPYPYAKYSQVAAADFIYGGMENTSATTQTERTLHDERAHLDFSSDPLVSHELAHQWFGDLVTCRDWGHGWLNESFATYCETLWREHDLGQDEFLYDLYGLLQAYLGESRERYTRPIVTNVYHDPSDVFDRHLYEKGGLVLHMIRRQLGDAAWWASVKHYLEAHRAGNVVTLDWQRAIEDVTGRNLEELFQQWVFSPGHPDLKVSYAWDAKSRLASVTVKQAEPAKGAAPGRLFALDFDLGFVLADGSVHTIPARLDTVERTFAVHLADEPLRVRFDPGFGVAVRTASFDLPLRMLQRQLADDPDVLLRIDAAKALGKKGDRQSVGSLAMALREERFWGVQTQVAKAMGEAKTSAAKDALLRAMDLPHPKARRGVVEALGAFREADVAEALKEKARKGDASYLVEAETFRSLGKTRQDGVYDV